MNIFKQLFATPEMVKKGFEAVSSGIDKAIFTTEESVDMWLTYLKATQPQNVSRRVIALVVTTTWAVFCFVVMFAIFFAETATRADLIQFGTIYIMPPFTILISWYFWKGVKEKK